jgi:hypothetical protein
MECPDCGGKTKVDNSRTIEKPGRDAAVLSEVAPLVGTRFFVWRFRSCKTCDWIGESVELTRQHLEYLLAEVGRIETAEVLEVRVRLVRTDKKQYKIALVSPSTTSTG